MGIDTAVVPPVTLPTRPHCTPVGRRFCGLVYTHALARVFLRSRVRIRFPVYQTSCLPCLLPQMFDPLPRRLKGRRLRALALPTEYHPVSNISREEKVSRSRKGSQESHFTGVLTVRKAFSAIATRYCSSTVVPTQAF
jgi:hypothetical protein